jgi:hypothetical protein
MSAIDASLPVEHCRAAFDIDKADRDPIWIGPDRCQVMGLVIGQRTWMSMSSSLWSGSRKDGEGSLIQLGVFCEGLDTKLRHRYT